LRTFDILVSNVRDVIRSSNMDVGGPWSSCPNLNSSCAVANTSRAFPDLQKIVLKNDGGTAGAAAAPAGRLAMGYFDNWNRPRNARFNNRSE
jgi:hypothetical protein